MAFILQQMSEAKKKVSKLAIEVKSALPFRKGPNIEIIQTSICADDEWKHLFLCKT